MFICHITSFTSQYQILSLFLHLNLCQESGSVPPFQPQEVMRIAVDISQETNMSVRRNDASSSVWDRHPEPLR